MSFFSLSGISGTMESIQSSMSLDEELDYLRTHGDSPLSTLPPVCSSKPLKLLEYRRRAIFLSANIVPPPPPSPSLSGFSSDDDDANEESQSTSRFLSTPSGTEQYFQQVDLSCILTAVRTDFPNF